MRWVSIYVSGINIASLCNCEAYEFKVPLYARNRVKGNADELDPLVTFI